MPPPPPLPRSWRPVARADVAFRRVGEDWVLFDAHGQRLHVLNLAAALVWSHCTGEHDVAEIERTLGEAFEVDVGEPGVEDVLGRFREAGLLLP